MRFHGVLLLGLALLLAGCTNDDGDGDVPGTNATTAPTTPGDGPGGEVNETFTHNFAPPNQPATEEVEVQNGTANVHVTISFSSPAPACQGGTARVLVKDADGTEVVNAAPGQAPGVGGCSGAVDQEVPVAAGGTWTVEFTGSGAVTATVTLTGM